MSAVALQSAAYCSITVVCDSSLPTVFETGSESESNPPSQARLSPACLKSSSLSRTRPPVSEMEVPVNFGWYTLSVVSLLFEFLLSSRYFCSAFGMYLRYKNSKFL